MMNQSSLHLSQKVFWFSASVCLLIGTFVFSWQVIRGRAAAVEFMGIKFTSEKAEQSIIAARDTLLTVRTRLTDASERSDLDGINESLPDLDEILKSLGVAEAALKRQRAHFQAVPAYTFDDEGLDWSGDGYSSPTPAPRVSKPR